MHVELHPLTMLAPKIGLRVPNLGLFIDGQALGGGISKELDTSPQPKQTNKHPVCF